MFSRHAVLFVTPLAASQNEGGEEASGSPKSSVADSTSAQIKRTIIVSTFASTTLQARPETGPEGCVSYPYSTSHSFSSEACPFLPPNIHFPSLLSTFTPLCSETSQTQSIDLNDASCYEHCSSPLQVYLYMTPKQSTHLRIST